MPSGTVRKHLVRSILAGVALVATGWFISYPLPVILTGLGIFIAWHAVNVTRLFAWLHNPERKVPASVGLWADIFEHMERMEARNQEQKQRYQSMISDFETLTNALPYATLLIDDSDEVTWFNTAAGTLLLLDDERDIGRPVTHLLRNPDFANWLAVQDQLSGQLEISTPGATDSWLNVSAVPIRGNKRLVILSDVSEVHQVDQIRRDFVTNVSHELRTPLTVMLGYLELFLDQPDADMSKAIPRMHKQAVQMQSMINDFLELSRLQSVDTHGRDERVEVPVMLLQLQEQAEEISRGEHVLRFEIEDGLNLCGISTDLESAFRNLIVNALKYTPEGGSVSVRWWDAANGPALEVTDTGIGIPTREIPRLTERFYRIGSDRGRKTGGTGLGLAIVKHVLNSHQAQLNIESDFGVGSRFSCIFPPERRRE